MISDPVFDDGNVDSTRRTNTGTVMLRGMLEALPALSWLADRSGTVRFVNRRWTEHVGLDALGLRIEELGEFLHPEDRELFNERWLEARRAQSGVALECRWQRLSEEATWFRTSLEPVLEPNGRMLGWLAMSTETDAVHRYRAGASFLADASEALIGSLELSTTLRNLARLSVPKLADFCSIYLANEQGLLERVETIHRNPSKAWASQALKAQSPTIDPAQAGVIGQVFNDGLTRRINHASRREARMEVDPKSLPEAFADALAPENAANTVQQAISQLPISQLIVPLRLRSSVIGVLNLGTNESGRRFDEQDERLAEELARRAAMSVEIAGIHAKERAARQAAEAAVNRTSRLQTVTAALAEAFLPTDVAEIVVYQSIQALGADAGAVYTVSADGQSLELVRAVGYAEVGLDEKRSLELARHLPLTDAAREQRAILIDSAAHWNEQYAPLTDPHGSPIEGAWIAVPLELQGRLLGAMELSTHTPRNFNEAERGFALTIARQCALALERSRLFAAELELKADLERRVEERTRELGARNAELEAFVYTASHDLRGPLLSISGMASMSADAVSRGDTTEAGFALERVADNVKRMNRLLNDLLTVSRVGRTSDPPETLDLGEIVAGITAELESRRRVRGARLDFPQTWPVVRMVRSELEQVISNLLENALRFAGRPGEPPTVWMDWAADGANMVRLRVADNGPGIAPEHRDQVFQLFWKQGDAGTGVGLSIVKRIAQSVGGRVWLDDSPDVRLGGACFAVTLPTPN